MKTLFLFVATLLVTVIESSSSISTAPELPCSGDPYCENGGTCSVSKGEKVCRCPPGYSGDRCENIPNPGVCPACGIDITKSSHSQKSSDSHQYVNIKTAFFLGFSGYGENFPIYGQKDVREDACTVDNDCGCDSKCCPSLKDGSRQCTSVSPPTQPPATSTCNNVRCAADTQCREVRDCPYCPTLPRCVNNSLIRQDIDNQCIQRGYSQAIIQVEPGTTNSYDYIKCTRAPNNPQCKCPSGWDCAGGKKEGGGFCCKGNQNPYPKEGTCPKKSSFEGDSTTACSTDQDCNGILKCCKGSNGIRNCVSPTESCGFGFCEEDEVCVERGACCPPGSICPMFLRIFCVKKGCDKYDACEIQTCTCTDTKHGSICCSSQIQKG